jgi:tetratricopeptide (TPR) repeat protein
MTGGSRAPAPRHLDDATLAGLGARERSLLFHVATCVSCRRRLAAEEWDRLVPWTPDTAADAAILRLMQGLERGTGLGDKLDAIGRERRVAADRVRELLATPDRWGTAAADPRYATVEIAWQLLATARDEEPALAMRLIDLASEIATVLAGTDFSALHRQLLVEVRCARAQRLLDTGDRRAAARELRRAGGQLVSELGYARALFCRALARLRRAERRLEEALALGERAVSLLDDYGSALEIGQAQIEQGWTLIEAGDPDDARPLLDAALPLVEDLPSWAASGRFGLAIALADTTGKLIAAGPILAAADRLTANVADPREQLRLRRLGAQAARRCGQSCSSLRRLCRVTLELLDIGEHYDAAGALLELVALCLDRQWQRALGLSQVRQAIAALSSSTLLHRRARAVVAHLGWALLDLDRRRAPEAVAAALRYLVASRHRPGLPFRPTPLAPAFQLLWDELEPPLRQSIALEVGAPLELGSHPSSAIAAAAQDLISWRYEVLHRVRILFAPVHPEPPAA